MRNLLPIGRFSEVRRLSIPALRHYGELGLLPPAGRVITTTIPGGLAAATVHAGRHEKSARPIAPSASGSRSAATRRRPATRDLRGRSGPGARHRRAAHRDPLAGAVSSQTAVGRARPLAGRDDRAGCYARSALWSATRASALPRYLGLSDASSAMPAQRLLPRPTTSIGSKRTTVASLPVGGGAPSHQASRTSAPSAPIDSKLARWRLIARRASADQSAAMT